MKKSESIKELSTALAKFQGEVTNPLNTATNPFFKSKYAPLNDILALVRPLLSKQGLSVIQTPISSEGMIGVTTLLLHESGEYIEFLPVMLNMDKPTAQGAGSAITYARRYAISAILGISSEDDDDGNAVEPKALVKAPVKTPDGKPVETKKDKLLNELFSLVKAKKYEKNIIPYLEKTYNKKSSKELNEQEVLELIELLKSMG